MSAVMEEKKEPLSSFRDRFGLERRGGEGGGGRGAEIYYRSRGENVDHD